MRSLHLVFLATAWLLVSDGHAAEKRPVANEMAVARAPIVSEADLRASLRSHRGHPMIVHFWASWCPPCLGELPLLAKLAADARRQGIAFVAVSLDAATKKNAERVGALLAERTGNAAWSPILRSPDAFELIKGLAPRWQGELPVFLAYDRKQRLVRTHIGDIDQRALDGIIAGLLRE